MLPKGCIEAVSCACSPSPHVPPLFVHNSTWIILKKHGFPSWTLSWPELASDGSWYINSSIQNHFVQPGHNDVPKAAREGVFFQNHPGTEPVITCQTKVISAPFGTSTNSASDGMWFYAPEMSSSQPGNRGRVSAGKYLLVCDMTRPKLITEVALGSEPNASSDSSGQLDREQLLISVTLLAATVTRSIRKPEGGEWKPAMSAVQDLFQHEAATKTSHISLFSDSPPPTTGGQNLLLSSRQRPKNMHVGVCC